MGWGRWRVQVRGVPCSLSPQTAAQTSLGPPCTLAGALHGWARTSQPHSPCPVLPWHRGQASQASLFQLMQSSHPATLCAAPQTSCSAPTSPSPATSHCTGRAPRAKRRRAGRPERVPAIPRVGGSTRALDPSRCTLDSSSLWLFSWRCTCTSSGAVRGTHSLHCPYHAEPPGIKTFAHHKPTARTEQ